MRFFIGDHPAQQLERGTQQGGTYKCGGCGVKNIRMDDLAHTLQLPWRSLEDLQKIAIDGKRGKIACDLNPFTKLEVNELSEELNSRSVTTTGMRRDQMEDILKGLLMGVQHVPTLPLLNHSCLLKDLNLQDYSILDCEPLHDLKGHLINLCKQLPFLLSFQQL